MLLGTKVSQLFLITRMNIIHSSTYITHNILNLQYPSLMLACKINILKVFQQKKQGRGILYRKEEYKYYNLLILQINKSQNLCGKGHRF